MKTITLYSILAYALLMLSATSCTKENILTDTSLMTEQTSETYQKVLAGSWTCIDEGVAIVMHDGQVCSFTGTKSPMIQWNNVSADEKRTFTASGGYSRYVNNTLSCEGTYQIAYVGSIELTTNCQNAVETVQELTANSLIIRDGVRFRKYRKME
jgi:hypothetical protein